jgi:predicted phosphodiesterase
MRIAVLADIHGNRLALDAVLADLERRGWADRVVDLGDCASGPLWPRETMERLGTLGALTVRGNHDRQVATLPVAAMNASDRFAHAELTPGQRDRLGSLPPALAVAPGVLAFHATPVRDDRYLLDEVEHGRLARSAPGEIARRLEGIGPARVVLCGHSHRPDFVRLPTGVLALNPGSVGCPAYDDASPPAHVSEAGSPHARYAILHVAEGGPDAADGAAVEFVALPYGHEEAARRAEANDRHEWAHALRTGRMPPTRPAS